MSRRPPSARDPRLAISTRMLPAMNRLTRGASSSRSASPLPSPLRNTGLASPGGHGGWTPEVIVSGYARVAADISPPGLRVPFNCRISAIYLRAGIAPTGADLVWDVNVNGTPVETLTITATGTATSSTGLLIDLVEGDIVTFDITQIGSTVAGADLAVQLIAA